MSWFNGKHCIEKFVVVFFSLYSRPVLKWLLWGTSLVLLYVSEWSTLRHMLHSFSCETFAALFVPSLPILLPLLAKPCELKGCRLISKWRASATRNTCDLSGLSESALLTPHQEEVKLLCFDLWPRKIRKLMGMRRLPTLVRKAQMQMDIDFPEGTLEQLWRGLNGKPRGFYIVM